MFYEINTGDQNLDATPAAHVQSDEKESKANIESVGLAL